MFYIWTRGFQCCQRAIETAPEGVNCLPKIMKQFGFSQKPPSNYLKQKLNKSFSFIYFSSKVENMPVIDV